MTLNIWGCFVGLPRHASHKFFQPSGIISLTLLLYPWGKWGRKRREKYHLLGTCYGEGDGTPLQYSCLENPMDGGAWWAAVLGVAKSWTRLSDFHFSLSHIGEQNGNPLQCSCLENPRDGGAWWAAVYGVAQSRTQLKWLSSRSRYLIWARSFLIIWIFLIRKWHWFWNHILGEN